MAGLTLWKWVPLKVVGHTLVLSDKRMSIKESVPSIQIMNPLYVGTNSVMWWICLRLIDRGVFS